MKRFLFLACVIAYPAWSQPADSIAATTIPPRSNFRSSVLLEGGYAYAFTVLPAIRTFFNTNQVERNKDLDKFVLAGFGYRRQRFKGMIHTFFGIDQSLLPPIRRPGQPWLPGARI